MALVETITPSHDHYSPFSSRCAMTFFSARQFFLREVSQPDRQINLELAALYLAQEEYPEIDITAYTTQLDRMAVDLQKRLPEASYPLKVIQTINRYLYDELGYYGNRDNYYDPRNSFLTDVLDRRTGIPISLALVYLALARRVDFPMVGVGLPGHFLIRPLVDDMEVFVDAFHQGEILFPQDCQERLNQLYGRPIELQPAFLTAVTNRQFLARMLGNLKGIYINQGQVDKALAAIERILLLFPQAPGELRDRGILYYRLNRLTEARQDLSTYLNLAPDAADALAIQELLEMLQGS